MCLRQPYLRPRRDPRRHVARLTQKAQQFKLGPDSDTATTHGPLIGPGAIVKSSEHVEDAQKRGAKLVCGGNTAPINWSAFWVGSINTG